LGYNTDIFGAIETIKNFKKKKIIIYGYGGAGEAILRTFYKTYKKSSFIVVSKKKILEFNKKRVKFVKKLEKDSLLSADIFINCSPLGSNLKKKYLKKSPLTTDQFQNINKNILIFDIVYKPKRTKLSYQCKNFSIKYVNGLKMNSFQALKALMIISKVYRNYGK
jgi:shikimate dehydrogenase